MIKLDYRGAVVAIFGDVMLDRYYMGQVDRISPEAPVPVVHVTDTRNTLGGAGNVAENVAHLGARAVLFGMAGQDEARAELESMLTAKSISSTLFESGSRTVTKIRVIGERQQIARLDFEDPLGVKEPPVEACVEAIDALKPGAIVISDYGKGFCTFALTSSLIAAASQRGIPVIVDPKGTDWKKYEGATLVTPNLKELSEVFGQRIANEDQAVSNAGMRILEQFRIQNLLVTRSEKGMTLLGATGAVHYPVEAKEVFDVSGAGDTVVAALATCLASGSALGQAVTLSNVAAGIVVGKLGTAPIELAELEDALRGINRKIVSWERLPSVLRDLRHRKKKTVFTNGCFDILHKGHVTLLREARRRGDVLIVGLNADSSVQRLKGEGRPVNNEIDRAEMLSGLESVDYVVIFEEDTPQRLIELVRPDVLVKGGDYTVETVVGREFAGQTVVLGFVDGYSTTRIINCIRDDR